MDKLMMKRWSRILHLECHREPPLCGGVAIQQNKLWIAEPALSEVEGSSRAAGLLAMTIVCLFFASACAPDLEWEYQSLAERLPRVVFVSPQNGEAVLPETKVVLKFSKAVDPASIQPKTISILKLEPTDSADPKKLASDVAGEKIQIEAGSYSVASDGQEVSFVPAQVWSVGQTYGILVSKTVRSLTDLPLQSDESDAVPFWSTFMVAGPVADAAVAGGAEVQTNTPQTTGENVSSADAAATISQPAPAKKSPTELVINEIYYDASGADTNGDIFIELAGTVGSEIGDYQINLISGDDGKIYKTIKLPAGAVIPSDGLYVVADDNPKQTGTSLVSAADFIANFDPQNGPDCVQLLSDDNHLWDALGYGLPLVVKTENGLSCYEGAPAPDVTSGHSLSRLEAQDSDNNLADFVSLEAPTPGVR